MIRREHRTQALRRQLVDLHPLHKNPLVIQTRAAELEKLLREQVRHARHPRMTRFTDDEIVTVWRHAQKSARIVDDQLRARIVEWSIVHVIEVLRSVNCSRFEFDARHRLNRRLQHRSDRHTRRIADDQSRFHLRRNEQRDLPEHHLRRHVVDAVRRVGAAVDGHRHCVLVPANRNRRRRTFLIHQQLVNVGVLFRRFICRPLACLREHTDQTVVSTDRKIREIHPRRDDEQHDCEDRRQADRETALQRRIACPLGGFVSDACDQEAAGRCEQQRKPRARLRYQHETGDERTGNRSNRVHCISTAHACHRFRSIAAGPDEHERHHHAHQQRWNQDQQSRRKNL